MVLPMPARSRLARVYGPIEPDIREISLSDGTILQIVDTYPSDAD